MRILETILTIGTVSLGTIITRFIPFIVFPADKPTPEYIKYLGSVLPYATTSMIVVYCLKDSSVSIYPYKIPELISIVFIIILHKWKKSMLISIGGGTALYMGLVQFVFKA